MRERGPKLLKQTPQLQTQDPAGLGSRSTWPCAMPPNKPCGGMRNKHQSGFSP